MATAIENPIVSNESYLDFIQDAIARIVGQRHIVYSDVSWDEYNRLVEYRDSTRKGIRLTYDRGSLEIMPTSFRHERWKIILSRIFFVITMERHIPQLGAGNLTIKRADLVKGFEPDECYYLNHIQDVIKLDVVDFTIHPVPDLAIESEFTCNIIDRLPLYAAFGIPEVWRCDDGLVEILNLNGTEYRATTRSRFLHDVTTELLSSYLERSKEIDDTTLMWELKESLKSDTAAS